jgi:hypothetical protein
MILTEEKQKYLDEKKKTVTVPLCPPYIPRGPTWDRTGASAVIRRRLAASALVRTR